MALRAFGMLAAMIAIAFACSKYSANWEKRWIALCNPEYPAPEGEALAEELSYLKRSQMWHRLADYTTSTLCFASVVVATIGGIGVLMGI